MGVLPRARQSSEAVVVPCPHQSLFPQARLAASPIAPAPSSFPCSFPRDAAAPRGPRLVPPGAPKEDASSGCGAAVLLCSLPPSHPGWQAGPHCPPIPPRLSSCSELHLPGDGHLLPATTRAMGQACWGVSKLKALTLLGCGRRGCQRSCGGWLWPMGLWARLGTAVTVVQSLLVVQDIVFPCCCWAQLHHVAGVFLACGKPPAWGACTALPTALPAVLAGLMLPQSPSMGPAGTGEQDTATPGNQR